MKIELNLSIFKEFINITAQLAITKYGMIWLLKQ